MLCQTATVGVSAFDTPDDFASQFADALDRRVEALRARGDREAIEFASSCVEGNDCVVCLVRVYPDDDFHGSSDCRREMDNILTRTYLRTAYQPTLAAKSVPAGRLDISHGGPRNRRARADTHPIILRTKPGQLHSMAATTSHIP